MSNVERVGNKSVGDNSMNEVVDEKINIVCKSRCPFSTAVSKSFEHNPGISSLIVQVRCLMSYSSFTQLLR